VPQRSVGPDFSLRAAPRAALHLIATIGAIGAAELIGGPAGISVQAHSIRQGNHSDIYGGQTCLLVPVGTGAARRASVAGRVVAASGSARETMPLEPR
jgi:hypothetical protein